MSEIQERFSAWLENEKRKELTGIKIFYGDLSGATVDSFLSEFMEIEQLIADGNHSPLPDTL